MASPTTSHVDSAVIGRGLLGAAAARHLADMGHRVALIGPGEPADPATHTGVFGSHYDSGRITRVLDQNPYYAQVAASSIAAYADVQERSGIDFFAPVGHLVVSPMADFVDRLRGAQQTHRLTCDELDDGLLSDRFPYLHFAPGMEALFERDTGGWIDPRSYIRACEEIVLAGGGVVVPSAAIATDLDTTPSGVGITTRNGHIETAKVLLASGAFANQLGLAPRPVDISVHEHTVVFAQISDSTAADLTDDHPMPTIIHKRGTEVGTSVYVMPPIRYPDGRRYIKIGQSAGHKMADPDRDLIPWFQSAGDDAIARWLTEELTALLPDLDVLAWTQQSCVTTSSPTGLQYIDQFDDSPVFALLAANGQVAKSADEIGRIAAHRMVHGQVPEAYAPLDFALRYR